jgi:hypothetical protein
MASVDPIEARNPSPGDARETLTSPASPHPLVAKAQRSDGKGLAVMRQLRPDGYPMRASPTIGIASSS